MSGLTAGFALTHGAGGGIESGGLPEFKAALESRGHQVRLFELAYRKQGRKSPPLAEKSVPGLVEAFEEISAGDTNWFCGGKSYGGRVASLAVAGGMQASGLVFLGYPLHRPGDPSSPRTAHWPDIKVPCLFLQGTRDAFCNLEVLKKELPGLAGPWTLHVVEGGNHSLQRGRGRVAETMEELAEVTDEWIQGL